MKLAELVIKIVMIVADWSSLDLFGATEVAKMAIARHIPLF